MRKFHLIIIAATSLFFCKTETMAQIFSLNVNTLSPVVLALQSELEVSVSQKYTLSLGMTIKPSGRNQTGGPYISARKFLKESFVGPFASLSAGFMTYKVNPEEKTGKSLYTSLSAGYSFILTKRLNLRLELGASLFYSNDGYTEYTPDPWEDDYKHTRDKFWLLPYPVSVSLCYLF